MEKENQDKNDSIRLLADRRVIVDQNQSIINRPFYLVSIALQEESQ